MIMDTFFPQEKKTNLTRIKYDFTAISEITSQMTIALRKKLAGVWVNCKTLKRIYSLFINIS